MTWINASGDNGAADCSEDQYASQLAQAALAVDAPASVPEVTGMGGTRLQDASGSYWLTANNVNGESLLGYIAETSWNDPPASDGTPSSSGGGASTFFSHPSWQTGTGVPADNFRHVPDVAMSASAAHDGYLVYTPNSDSCSTGSVLCVFGGTSAPTPAFAGIVALLNQYLLANGIQRTSGVGNINPNLYTLAQSTPSLFHDVTSGDNIVFPVVCNSRGGNCRQQTTSIGYSAGAGYDSVTGLGSVDATQLITCWTGTCASSATPGPAVYGLTDAAAFQQVYSAGMLMAVFGSHLSPTILGASSVPLPSSMAGTYATINGEIAPLLYVSPTQLNIQIPWDIPTGTANLVVYNNGVSTSETTFQVVTASPAIFTDTTRTIVPSGSTARGQVASLYMTGQGPVSPQIATGAAPDTSIPLNRLPASSSISVTVGGVPASLTCSNYCFEGIPYGLVGVTQINFQVAPDTPLGIQPVVVTAAGIASPAAYINVTN
jgi:uncharacterized protein (TIGR03437 family)